MEDFLKQSIGEALGGKKYFTNLLASDSTNKNQNQLAMKEGWRQVKEKMAKKYSSLEAVKPKQLSDKYRRWFTFVYKT